MADGTTIRLQKYLARAGVAARRKAEELIAAGAVQVNGQVVKEPFHRITLGVDEVRCEGQLLQPARPAYYKLHKPTGVLSAMGEAEVPTIETLLPPEMGRVFPVGRLDFDAAGLVLLTNDGDLANLLLHPRHHVEKRYEVLLKPCPSRHQLQRLESGIVLDGKPTKSSTWELKGRSQGGQCVVEVVLTEGRKNQIKRMANAVGSEVRALQRVAFGPILLGHLKPGGFKKLAPGEVAALKAVAEKTAGAISRDDDEGDDED
ncbi:MAG TPA: pseudouridine synthase [bacterium]|nr:pseudouridine synthase [bacterium]